MNSDDTKELALIDRLEPRFARSRCETGKKCRYERSAGTGDEYTHLLHIKMACVTLKGINYFLLRKNVGLANKFKNSIKSHLKTDTYYGPEGTQTIKQIMGLIESGQLRKANVSLIL